MLRLLLPFPPAAHLRRTLGALAASSGMHAAVLATLALAVVQAHRGASPEPTKASLILPTTAGALESAGIDGSLAGATRPQPAEASALTEPIANQAETTGHSLLPTPVDSIRTGALAAQGGWLNKIDLASADDPHEEAVEETPRVGPAGGAKPGGGDGKAGYSFFGLDASGDKVVFVVDASGSMHGRRFFRARGELQRSIESLRENQQFYVIFFSDDAIPMPSEKLLWATKDNISQTVQWLKYLECGGGTNPLPGLLMAMELHPDSIYLLTDGKFDPQIVWEVSQAEPEKPIPIYTISFASRSAEKLLRTIANETGGVYRFVK